MTNKSGSSKKLVLLPIKTLISLPAKHKKPPASKPLKKENVATSKGKDVTEQTRGKASGRRAVRPVEGEKAVKPTGSKKFKSPVKSPGSACLKLKPATKITKKKDENSAVVREKVETVLTVFCAKQVKGSRTVIRAKNRALKTLKGFRTKELTEKTTKVSSESTAVESQAEGSGIYKPKHLVSRVQVKPKKSAKQTRFVTESEKILQIELKANPERIKEDKDTTLELEKSGGTEPEEAEGPAEDKNPTAAKVFSVLMSTGEDVTQLNKSVTQPPQTQQTTPQVQPNLDSPAQKPDADMKTDQDLAPECSPKAAFEAVLAAGNVETKTNQEGRLETIHLPRDHSSS